MRWVKEEYNYDEAYISSFAKKLNNSEFVAKLLLRVGIDKVVDAQRFLFPKLSYLDDPFAITNLSKAIDKIAEACENGENIAVVSDYDVDGITSIVLLFRCFALLGYQFTPFFPVRENEGYGLSEKLVNRVLESGKFSLLISLDCGTNSRIPIDILSRHRVETIVIDHHQQTEFLPSDTIVVNPHVFTERESTSAQQLCTVGLVFKLIHGWIKKLRNNNCELAKSIKLRPFLDLVALGTIADMVPLQNENRVFVSCGLKELGTTQIVGLRSLMNVSEIEPNIPVTTDDVSFKIAPRINVSGRLSSAELPFNLLVDNKAGFCKSLAEELNEMNIERQKVEKDITKQAEKMLLDSDLNKKAHVLYDKGWHVGVVGIVAGKLTRKYNKPVFVLGNQDDVAKGSGRSIEGINLTTIFQKANNLITQWGGHPAAVGLTVELKNIEKLESKINQIIDELFPNGLPEKILKIVDEIDVEEVSTDLLNDIDKFAPFGQGNEAPVFAIKNLTLDKSPERFGQLGAHIKFNLPQNPKILVIGWNFPHSDIPINSKFKIAVKASWSYWRNEKLPQLQLISVNQ